MPKIGETKEVDGKMYVFTGEGLRWERLYTSKEERMLEEVIMRLDRVEKKLNRIMTLM